MAIYFCCSAVIKYVHGSASLTLKLSRQTRSQQLALYSRQGHLCLESLQAGDNHASDIACTYKQRVSYKAEATGKSERRKGGYRVQQESTHVLDIFGLRMGYGWKLLSAVQAMVTIRLLFPLNPTLAHEILCARARSTLLLPYARYLTLGALQFHLLFAKYSQVILRLSFLNAMILCEEKLFHFE